MFGHVSWLDFHHFINEKKPYSNTNCKVICLMVHKMLECPLKKKTLTYFSQDMTSWAHRQKDKI